MKFKRMTAPMAALAAAALFGAMPAAAQPGYGSNGWDREAFWRGAPADPYQRMQFLQRRIDRGVADGSLSRTEARQAQRDLRHIQRLIDRMGDGPNNRLSRSDYREINWRLDQLSQRIRWQRQDWASNGNGYTSGASYAPDYSRFRTNYDAARYYRPGGYSERRLTAADEVYRGSDGRYYCKRNDGTTGLIVGAAGGGILGNIIDGGHNRLAGTLIGGALGALAGKTIDQNSDIRCR